MHRSPAFQFYPRDWDTDKHVVPMTYEEEGVYWALCRRYWLDGGLPADLDEVRSLLKRNVTRTQFARWWVRIGRCFQQAGDRLIHKRLDEERAKQEAWRKKCAKGGRKSGQTRAQSDRKGSSTTLRRVVQQPFVDDSKGSSTLHFASSSALCSTDQHQDQEHRAAPGPADSPVEKSTDLPRDRPSFTVIRAVAHDLLGQQAFDDDGEFREALKRRCAQLRIAYDSEAVRKVADALEHARRSVGHA